MREAQPGTPIFEGWYPGYDELEYEDLLREVDDHDDYEWSSEDFSTVERFAHSSGNTLEKVRLELAELHYAGAIEMTWIDERAFFWRDVDDEDVPLTLMQRVIQNCELATHAVESDFCTWCAEEANTYDPPACKTHQFFYARNHQWVRARAETLRNAKHVCRRCGGYGNQVNHIVPILGRHDEDGCWHHQGNLESICPDCHLVATKEQRDQGLFVPENNPWGK